MQELKRRRSCRNDPQRLLPRAPSHEFVLAGGGGQSCGCRVSRRSRGKLGSPGCGWRGPAKPHDADVAVMRCGSRGGQAAWVVRALGLRSDGHGCSTQDVRAHTDAGQGKKPRFLADKQRIWVVASGLPLEHGSQLALGAAPWRWQELPDLLDDLRVGAPGPLIAHDFPCCGAAVDLGCVVGRRMSGAGGRRTGSELGSQTGWVTHGSELKAR